MCLALDFYCNYRVVNESNYADVYDHYPVEVLATYIQNFDCHAKISRLILTTLMTSVMHMYMTNTPACVRGKHASETV
jgi:hypothetical protein